MANKNKAKGTAAETRVVKFLKEYGIDAKRKALTGSEDCGDIELLFTNSTYILEVKAGKQTVNPSRAQLEEWIRQTIVEETNCKKSNDYVYGWLVVARYGRSVKDYDVWWVDTLPATSNRVLNHLYLDEFREFIHDNLS